MVEVGKVVDYSGRRWKVLEVTDNKVKLKCTTCIGRIITIDKSKLNA